MDRSQKGSRKPGAAVTFGELRDRIKAARRSVHVELRDRAAIGAERQDDRAVADALVTALGLRTLGDQWVALDAPRGYQVAYEVLWRDLAYRSSQIMDPARAEELAREFLGHFAPDARFLTNFTSLDPTFDLAKVGSNSSIGLDKVEASLTSELQTKIGSELVQALQTGLSTTSTYSVQTTTEKSEALEFVVPPNDGSTGTRRLFIYFKLRQLFWDVYLIRTDYLELEYKQNWVWPDVRNTIVQREIPVRQPLFRIEYYEPYSDFSFAFDSYQPEVESGDAVTSMPLMSSSPSALLKPTHTMEQIAKLAFPVSRAEKKTAKATKTQYTATKQVSQARTGERSSGGTKGTSSARSGGGASSSARNAGAKSRTTSGHGGSKSSGVHATSKTGSVKTSTGGSSKRSTSKSSGRTSNSKESTRYTSGSGKSGVGTSSSAKNATSGGKTSQSRTGARGAGANSGSKRGGSGAKR